MVPVSAKSNLIYSFFIGCKFCFFETFIILAISIAFLRCLIFDVCDGFGFCEFISTLMVSGDCGLLER